MRPRKPRDRPDPLDFDELGITILTVVGQFGALPPRVLQRLLRALHPVCERTIRRRLTRLVAVGVLDVVSLKAVAGPASTDSGSYVPGPRFDHDIARFPRPHAMRRGRERVVSPFRWSEPDRAVLYRLLRVVIEGGSVYSGADFFVHALHARIAVASDPELVHLQRTDYARVLGHDPADGRVLGCVEARTCKVYLVIGGRALYSSFKRKGRVDTFLEQLKAVTLLRTAWPRHTGEKRVGGAARAAEPMVAKPSKSSQEFVRSDYVGISELLKNFYKAKSTDVDAAEVRRSLEVIAAFARERNRVLASRLRKSGALANESTGMEAGIPAQGGAAPSSADCNQVPEPSGIDSLADTPPDPYPVIVADRVERVRSLGRSAGTKPR